MQASGAPSGTRTPHSRGALDRFRAQTGRFLFARRRPSAPGVDAGEAGDLVYLEQGTAGALRREARSSLMCPETGCGSPEITTVSRSKAGRRDGFRHLVRPDRAHATESALHRQGKAMVVRWARTLVGVDAHEEVPVVGPDGRVERVADVLLTSAGGNRMAVEVQYAAISVEEWRRRDESYRDLGVSVTWLWGHCGAQSPVLGGFRDTAKTLLARPAPVLWINPAEEQIAWAWDLSGHEEPPRSLSWPDYLYGTLDDLDVRQTGLFPPGFLTDRNEVIAEATPRREAREAKEAAEEEAKRNRPTLTERMAQINADAIAAFRREQAARPPAPTVYTVLTERALDGANGRRGLELRLSEQPLGAPETPEPPQQESEPAPPRPQRRACYRCGGRLDDVLLSAGFHIGCE